MGMHFFKVSLKLKMVALLIVVAFSFTIFVALSGLKLESFKGLISIDETTERLNNTQLKLYGIYEELQFLVLNASSGTGSSSEESQKKMSSSHEKMELLKQYFSTHEDENLMIKFNGFITEADKVLKLLKEESALEASEVALQKLPKNFDSLTADVHKKLTDRLQSSKTNSEEVISSIDKFNMFLATTSLFTLLGFIVASVFIIDFLLKPVVKAKEQLAHWSHQLTDNSGQMKSNSDSLNRSATSSSSSLSNTVSTLDEITAMVNRNLSNVESSTEKSTTASNAAKEGSLAVTEMLGSMKNIESSNDEMIEELNEVVTHLSEMAKIINDIKSKTSVINDIVFQTKLLSFNASVEAARAGEQGKGFAVVAEEVGNLAAASGSAATEIASMLDSSITKVNQIVETTTNKLQNVSHKGRSSVELGFKKAKECSSALIEILSNVNVVNEMINDISVSSKEQALGIENLNNSLQDINTLSGQAATIAKEVLSNSAHVDGGANGITKVVNDLEALIYGSRSQNKNAISLINKRSPSNSSFTKKAS